MFTTPTTPPPRWPSDHEPESIGEEVAHALANIPPTVQGAIMAAIGRAACTAAARSGGDIDAAMAFVAAFLNVADRALEARDDAEEATRPPARPSPFAGPTDEEREQQQRSRPEAVTAIAAMLAGQCPDDQAEALKMLFSLFAVFGVAVGATPEHASKTADSVCRQTAGFLTSISLSGGSNAGEA